MSRHRKRRGRPRPRPAAATATTARRPAPPAARAALDPERPQAPWHPFPLVELCVLVGIVLMVAGVITGLDGGRGRLLLVAGMALGSLGGLDTAAREHFAGYRSHTTVLAALPAVVAAALLAFLRVPWIAVVLGAAAVLAGALVALRRAWRRAT